MKANPAPQPIVKEYRDQHHDDWSLGWMQAAYLECQRDQYPPANIWQARDNSVWIRLIHSGDNASAGQLFKGCPDKEREAFFGERFLSESTSGRRTYDVW
jgi:chitinase